MVDVRVVNAYSRIRRGMASDPDPDIANAWKYAREGDLVGLRRVPPAALNEPQGGWTPLCLAVEQGHHECVQYLLSPQVNVDVDRPSGRTNVRALHLAAYNGDLSMCALLLNKYADLRMQTTEDQTPADVARARGHTALADLLERARIAQNGQLLEANNEMPISMAYAFVCNPGVVSALVTLARVLPPY